MGKIVVLASAEDSEAVKTALEGASLDFDVIEPTAANLLHIVIGMVDDSAEDEPKDEEPTVEEPAEETPPEEAPSEELPPEEAPVEESLGTVIVSGEAINAFKSKSGTSSIFVKSLLKDTKTSFSINESVFSFWPTTPDVPVSRMNIEIKNNKVAADLSILESKKEQAYLMVGTDLMHLFK